MRERIYIIFDGTSHYIIPEHEYEPSPDIKIERVCYDLDNAQRITDMLNRQCIDNLN